MEHDSTTDFSDSPRSSEAINIAPNVHVALTVKRVQQICLKTRGQIRKIMKYISETDPYAIREELTELHESLSSQRLITMGKFAQVNHRLGEEFSFLVERISDQPEKVFFLPYENGLEKEALALKFHLNSMQINASLIRQRLELVIEGENQKLLPHRDFETAIYPPIIGFFIRKGDYISASTIEGSSFMEILQGGSSIKITINLPGVLVNQKIIQKSTMKKTGRWIEDLNQELAHPTRPNEEALIQEPEINVEDWLV